MKISEFKEYTKVKSNLTSEFIRIKEAIKALESQKTAIQAKIRLKMLDKDVEMLFNGAEFVRETESKQVTVNVKLYEKLVNHDEFLKSVKVSVKDARNYIAEGQLDKISLSIPKPTLLTGLVK